MPRLPPSPLVPAHTSVPDAGIPPTAPGLAGAQNGPWACLRPACRRGPGPPKPTRQAPCCALRSRPQPLPVVRRPILRPSGACTQTGPPCGRARLRPGTCWPTLCQPRHSTRYATRSSQPGRASDRCSVGPSPPTLPGHLAAPLCSAGATASNRSDACRRATSPSRAISRSRSDGLWKTWQLAGGVAGRFCRRHVVQRQCWIGIRHSSGGGFGSGATSFLHPRGTTATSTARLRRRQALVVDGNHGAGNVRPPPWRELPPPRRRRSRSGRPRSWSPRPPRAGNWTSPAFTIAGGTWNIGWAFQCAPAPSGGPSFQIFVVNSGAAAGTTPAVTSTAASGQAVSPETTAGSQQIIVQTTAACRWAVKVTGSSS